MDLYTLELLCFFAPPPPLLTLTVGVEGLDGDLIEELAPRHGKPQLQERGGGGGGGVDRFEGAHRRAHRCRVRVEPHLSRGGGGG